MLTFVFEIALIVIAVIGGIVFSKKKGEKKPKFLILFSFLAAIVILSPWLFFDFRYIFPSTSSLAIVPAVFSLTLAIQTYIKRKIWRRTLLTSGVILTLIIVSIIRGFIVFGQAFGTDYTKLAEWRIDGYTVTHYQKLGWAGPSYNEYELRKNAIFGLIYKKVGSSTIIDTDCTIVFDGWLDTHIYEFNKCEKTLNINTKNKEGR